VPDCERNPQTFVNTERRLVRTWAMIGALAVGPGCAASAPPPDPVAVPDAPASIPTPKPEPVAAPSMPDLYDLGNLCRPGHCIGREWRLERRGDEVIADQDVDWIPPERRGQARIVAAPRIMTSEEASRWLASGGMPGLDEPVVRTETLSDGFCLVVGDRVVSFRVLAGVQIVCAPTSSVRVSDANFFCAKGFSDKPSRIPPTTTHAWSSLRPEWELPPREGLATTAYYRGGRAAGHERTQVMLRDPVAEAELSVFEKLVLEKGAIQAGFVWRRILRSERIDEGFVLEGMNTSAYFEGKPEESDFIVVRRTQGHWVMCELINLEAPEHYDSALSFCKNGFR